MCGIVGYIGENVEKILLEGLSTLEYRGYDSAGIAVLRNGKIELNKRVGKVEVLKQSVKDKKKFGIGIAHTRWATHGKVCIENAHPQFSRGGDIAIVHNGIIENYDILKANLIKDGVRFSGDTDSEVIAKLFEDKLNLKSLKVVLQKLEGSYALVLLSKYQNKLYFAKNKSPLYVAVENGRAMVASDPSCFVNFSKKYFDISDGEYGFIDKNSINVYNKGIKVEKTSKSINFKFSSQKMDGYSHYMIKEIYQCKDALNNIIQNYNLKNIQSILEHIKNCNINRIYIIGCGTAYHAGLIGKNYLKNQTNFEVNCELASEFIYQNNLIDNKSLCIFISQSGETADTISALKYCQKHNAITLSITNVEYSTLAKQSRFVLPIFAEQERAVASTKAYFAQVLVLYILSKVLAKKEYITTLKKFQKDLSFNSDDIIIKLSKIISLKDQLFFIGRGIDYITCQEGALKLKEVSYINCQAMPSGELKHGTLALIDNKSLVITIITDKKLLKKSINNACEIKSRGGKLILFTCFKISLDFKNVFDYIVKIKPTLDEFMCLQSIIPLQKLAYFIALQKGNNPDMPRNLAKSVTVE